MRNQVEELHARLGEYAEALAGDSRARVADALVDLAHTVDAAARDHGIDLTANPRTTRAVKRQRLAAYALLRRRQGDDEEEVLLTRISSRGHHTGSWTLPGGGVEHGEQVRDALTREVQEETGLTVRAGTLLDVHSVHFTGRAPNGQLEDFHGVHLIFAAEITSAQLDPRVVESDGSTDAVAWIRRGLIDRGEVRVLDVVRHALHASA